MVKRRLCSKKFRNRKKRVFSRRNKLKYRREFTKNRRTADKFKSFHVRSNITSKCLKPKSECGSSSYSRLKSFRNKSYI